MNKPHHRTELHTKSFVSNFWGAVQFSQDKGSIENQPFRL